LLAGKDRKTVDMKGYGKKLVVFNLDEKGYALYIETVKRIVLAVEITPLPKAPEIVAGVINIGGKIIPVFNIRARFHLPDREMRLSDKFIVARTSRRTVALLVDDVAGVVECDPLEITDAGAIMPALEYIDGIIKLNDGMVLIHDLDTFLSLEEERNLEDAIGLRGGEGNA